MNMYQVTDKPLRFLWANQQCHLWNFSSHFPHTSNNSFLSAAVTVLIAYVVDLLQDKNLFHWGKNNNPEKHSRWATTKKTFLLKKGFFLGYNSCMLYLCPNAIFMICNFWKTVSIVPYICRKHKYIAKISNGCLLHHRMIHCKAHNNLWIVAGYNAHRLSCVPQW